MRYIILTALVSCLSALSCTSSDNAKDSNKSDANNRNSDAKTIDVTCQSLCESDPEFRSQLLQLSAQSDAFAIEGCPDLSKPCGCALFEDPFALTQGLDCMCSDPFERGIITLTDPLCEPVLYQAYRRFSGLEPLGFSRVKQVDDNLWVRSCGDPSPEDRVRFNFALKRTSGDPSQTCETKDCDLGIRPDEDFINLKPVTIGQTLAADSFDLSIKEIQPHDGTTYPNAESSDEIVDTVKFDDLAFTNHLGAGGRGTPIGVVILIDQSGSLIGNVDPDTCIEGKIGEYDYNYSAFQKCASDSKGLRISAARELIENLNKNDAVAVFSFNEETTSALEPVCGVPGVDAESEEFLLDNCYTANKAYALEAMKQYKGLGKESGRSNLWTAVNEAYAYLKKKPQTVRHIVVLTDGPDTCDSESPWFQHCFESNTGDTNPIKTQTGCGVPDAFNALKQNIEDSYSKAKTTHTHISFVHFQSKAYPAMDPYMQSIACLSDGHYQFINNNQLSAENIAAKQKAFSDAIKRIRLTMGGYWNLRSNKAANTSGTPFQKLLTANFGTGSVTGVLAMNAPGLGKHTTKAQYGNGYLDQRFHMPAFCNDNTECGNAKGETCDTQCSSSTNMCMTPPAGATCWNGSEQGRCCLGTCGDGHCTAENPNPLPGFSGPITFCP